MYRGNIFFVKKNQPDAVRKKFTKVYLKLKREAAHGTTHSKPVTIQLILNPKA